MVKEELPFTETGKDTPEYGQIYYIHLVKLKLLSQSMQVLELFKGKVDIIHSCFIGQKATSHLLLA